MALNKPQTVTPDYGVPYTKFERAADGFTVTYKRLTMFAIVIGLLPLIIIVPVFESEMDVIFSSKGDSLADYIIAFAPLIGLFLLIRALRPKTVIVVDSNSVTVGKKRMSRSDFGGFVVYGSLNVGSTTNSATLYRLGYQFGRRSFPISGLWDERKVKEVVAALNDELRTSNLNSTAA